MKYEMYKEIDSIGKQVTLLATGFVVGMWVMNQRMNELEEKVDALLSQELRHSEQRAIGHTTGGSISSGTEDSERGTAKLSAVEYGK